MTSKVKFTKFATKKGISLYDVFSLCPIQVLRYCFKELNSMKSRLWSANVGPRPHLAELHNFGKLFVMTNISRINNWISKTLKLCGLETDIDYQQLVLRSSLTGFRAKERLLPVKVHAYSYITFRTLAFGSLKIVINF